MKVALITINPKPHTSGWGVVVLTPTQHLFSYISREQVIFQWDDDEVRFVLDQHAELDLYSATSSHWNNMSLHLDTLFWFRAIKPLLLLLITVCLAKKKQIPLVFGLIQPGLEPTIYRTRGEHANHYTTDAVKLHTTMVDSKINKTIIIWIVHSNLPVTFYENNVVRNINKIKNHDLFLVDISEDQLILTFRF